MTSTFITAGLIVTGIACEAKAERQFYKGKTIVIVVPYSPGGSFDLLARIIAMSLPKYTGSKVLIRNMPGGGGIVAYNHMFKAKPDGLTMAITHGPKMLSSELFHLKGVRYKAGQFTYLGNLYTANNILVVGKNAPWKEPKDVASYEGPFRIAATKPFYEPQWAEAFGLRNARVIPGYGGFGEKVAAIARGEVQACVGAVPGYVAHKDTIKILAMTFKVKAYPDIKSIREAALPGKEKWVEYMEMWPDVMRMMIAPPQVPEARAKFLEDALRKVHSDTKFQQEAKRLQAELRAQFASREDVKRSVEKVTSLDEKEIEQLKYTIEKKYLPK